MYKIQIRPPLGCHLATPHSSPYQTSSQRDQRHPLHFIKILTFKFNCKSAVLPLLACIVSIILSGCGGLVWNPGVLGSITPTPGTVKFGPVMLGQEGQHKSCSR